MHLAVDAHGMPVRAIVTQGTTADCKQAVALIDGYCAQYLLADRGYDTDEILDQAMKRGITPVIPARKNRKEQRKVESYNIVN